MTDQDPLLRIALDHDRGVHLREVALAFHLVDHHRHRMRHFLARHREGLLPDELGESDLERLIGDLAVGEEGGPFRQVREQHRPQLLDAVTHRGRDRHDLVPVPQRLRGRQLRHHLGVGEPVDLVDHADLRGVRFARHLLRVDERIAAPDAHVPVDHEDDHVDAGHGVAHQVVQARPQQRPRLVEPRRVGEDDLGLVGGPDGADVPARGLGLVRDDRDLLPHQPVDQGGLADVGPAHHRDHPGPEAGHGWKSSGPKACGSSSSIDQ